MSSIFRIRFFAASRVVSVCYWRRQYHRELIVLAMPPQQQYRHQPLLLPGNHEQIDGQRFYSSTTKPQTPDTKAQTSIIEYIDAWQQPHHFVIEAKLCPTYTPHMSSCISTRRLCIDRVSQDLVSIISSAAQGCPLSGLHYGGLEDLRTE